MKIIEKIFFLIIATIYSCASSHNFKQYNLGTYFSEDRRSSLILETDSTFTYNFLSHIGGGQMCSGNYKIIEQTIIFKSEYQELKDSIGNPYPLWAFKLCDTIEIGVVKTDTIMFKKQVFVKH